MEDGSGQGVLVIGAGMAGLTCARALRDAGCEVSVIDKARGPGGRASTRRSPVGGFDHGAQYLTARDPAFRTCVARWIEDGHAARWNGRIGTLRNGRIEAATEARERLLGTPRMSALLRHLGSDLDLHFGRRAVQLAPSADGWRVACEDGARLGPYASMVVATPSPQAAPLLEAAPTLASRVSEAAVDPCWAVMLGFDQPLPLPLDGAFVVDSPLAWASRESSKPGRAAGERWVLHGSPAWSAAHVDAPREAVTVALLDAFAEAVGSALPTPVHRDAHRWLYARTRRALGTACLLDESAGIGVCGDYCLGERVEDAWQSGRALAEALIAKRPR